MPGGAGSVDLSSGVDGIAKKSTFQLSVPQLGQWSSFKAFLERSTLSASFILASASGSGGGIVSVSS